MRSIYLDYNATTPLDRQVRESMLPFLDEIWGNASSIHHIGRRARALLDEARDRAGQVLGSKPSEVIFTSGGTEANNLAIMGTARLLKNRGNHIVTSTIEHPAVLHSLDYLARKEGFRVTHVPVDSNGLVDAGAVSDHLTDETILVSIMAANNEIGSVQPVSQIGALCREKGIIFHTDAVQWFGKKPFTSVHQFNADLVTVCPHKFHGPKGCGLLFIRSPLHPDPLIFGGGQENESRAGTENLVMIMGLVEALERFAREPVFMTGVLSHLKGRLFSFIQSLPGIRMVGSADSGLVNTVSFCVERSDSMALLAGLDMEGICASSGSACSSGSLEPSHVIKALGWSDELANSLVRFSLGRETTAEDIAYVEESLPLVILRAQVSG